MTLSALFFVLLFVVPVVCGIRVSMYLYANGALGGKLRQGKKPSLSSASFGQTATIPTPAAASDLYLGGIGVQNEDRASQAVRLVILYALGMLIALVVLAVLVIGATQF